MAAMAASWCFERNLVSEDRDLCRDLSWRRRECGRGRLLCFGRLVVQRVR
jgi:hypothetical protein